MPPQACIAATSPSLRAHGQFWPEETLMLAEGPAFVHDQPHVPVNLAEQRDIVPAGLFGKLGTGGGP
jgi:hypothetical protein